jgi:hypothetical protein
MKKQILTEEFIRMQKLAGVITESQYEDLTLESEDMDDTYDNLVIIGSGYLDIENDFRERSSQTNNEYAKIGQWVVDNLKTITKGEENNDDIDNGDIEAALDFIYSKINESNTNESQLDEGETENPNSIKVNAKVNNKETKVSIDQDNFPLNVTIKWDKDRDDMSNRPVRSKQDDENSDYAKYWLEDHAEELDFESGDLLDDHGSEGKVMLFTATSRDKMWDFEVEVQVPYNYEDSGNINDIDWRTLEITSKNEMEQLTKQKNKTMTLKELQKMIKEEFNAYMGEAEDDVEVSVSDNDVDAEMGDEMAPAGDEDVLRKIYDLLDAHFNGGEEAEEAPEEEAPADDVEGEEEESDLDENSTTDAKFQKTGMAPMSKGSAGPNVGYGTVGGKGSTGYDASSKALQERFQKLANIIK